MWRLIGIGIALNGLIRLQCIMKERPLQKIEAEFGAA